MSSTPTPKSKFFVPAKVEITSSDSDEYVSNSTFSADDSQDEPIYTQTESDILDHIRNSCGTLTKPLCIQRITAEQDTSGLASVREALYDYVRIHKSNTMPPGALIRRRPKRRGTGDNITAILASDIYTLYMFIEGAANISEVKLMLNTKSKSRKSMVASQKSIELSSKSIDPTSYNLVNHDQIATLLASTIEMK
ncbi:unnamed protein product [Owenia fusiformis]|uniref:Uncharacterized protein n=1 Tax=Owenia fusiformis TaxID=6347 RepID=A0A8J1XJU4_OWEFU|nr:unnamed protein product [Owenia fusiformis]